MSPDNSQHGEAWARGNEGSSPSAACLFQKGDRIDKKYIVERMLGSGATAVTYLVRDINDSDNRSVIKTIKEPLDAVLFASREFQALKDLKHRAIPRVLEVRERDAPYHIRREYVDGVALADLSGEFPWPMDRVLSFGYEILDALSELEQHKLAHRDLSARNVVISNDGPKLIDFGLATLMVESQQTVVGTPAFRAPELDRMQGWNSTCDTYSLGVMLFWIATGVFPFAKDIHGQFDKGQLVSTPLPANMSVEDARPYNLVLSAIRRAVAPDQEKRYHSAADFKAALREACAAQVPCLQAGRPVINEWVKNLQGLYRNSRLGNADNRGLDTDFAIDTYVPTRLDTELIPRVLHGDYVVVLLSGNPGDGKTAWLEKLGEEIADRDADGLPCDMQNGWRYKLGARTFAANYDASESNKDKGADELLNEILAPLRGDQPPHTDLGYTALIAINDGKLREFLLSNRDYNWLGKQVFRLLDEPKWNVDNRVALVDLKQRSVVGGDLIATEQGDLYEQVLLRLLKKEDWSECEGCNARAYCPMKFNRDTLTDPEKGHLVRSRLRTLLQITHLRRERHVTMRDLRSALAYIVAGTSTCEEIHAEIESDKRPSDWYNRFYFMATFNPNAETEENLKDFELYDPAQVTSPRLDRFLHFRRHEEDREHLEGLMSPLSLRSDQPLKAITVNALGKSWYEANKRRLFYEGNTDKLEASEEPLPKWNEMLPYRYFPLFLGAVTGREPMETVKSLICKGISRAGGIADRDLNESCLCVRTSKNDAVNLTVFKRFPLGEFECRIINSTAKHVEILPNALVLSHTKSDARIVIGLDLFEILMRFEEGYEQGAEEQQPFVIDLAQFQSRLLNQPAMELLLLESGRLLHRVRQEDGNVRLLKKNENSDFPARPRECEESEYDARGAAPAGRDGGNE